MHDFRKKVIEHKMCVLIFSTAFVWSVFHSKHLAKCDRKCILVFMWSTLYSCPILMKLEFSRQIFEKFSNIKFHENPCSCSLVPCGQTDGRTDITKPTVTFRNFAKASKNNSGYSQHTLIIRPLNLILEGQCIIFCNIYTFQRDTQCSSNGPSSGASF